MSSSAHNDVLHDTQAASFEAYAKQFLRTYPVLMSLRRDAQKQECSRLQRLLDDGLVYTVYLEGPVKRPGRDYDLVTEWNKWRVVLNHSVSNTDADVALRWVMDHNHSRVVEYIVALECAQYLVNAERHRCHPLDDETGKDILDYASQDGDMGLIRFLLSLDYSKWMKQICHSPRTKPLHWASLYGQDDVVRFFLVECGAAVDAPGMWGRTPLHLAAKNGHLAVVKLLTLYGANAHIKDGVPYPTRNTALHFAAAENHISIVRFLVENCDVDIDEKGFAGGTPLHMAARNGHVEIVEYLVRAGRMSRAMKGKVGNQRRRLPIHAAMLILLISFSVRRNGVGAGRGLRRIPQGNLVLKENQWRILVANSGKPSYHNSA